jgi:hypothetical protein
VRRKYSPQNKNDFADHGHRHNSLIGFDQLQRPYDAIGKCRSAGIIPYAIHNNKLYFLFQTAVSPIRKKNDGWNDFGGKKLVPCETTAEVAAREFSEETSCLFYIKDQLHLDNSNIMYDLLKDNENLYYSDDTIILLKKLIPDAQKYFTDKINEYALPLYVSSKETYISYLIKVCYIPTEDIPRAEDIHIPYEERYIRTCKWFTFEELMVLDEISFHKRLQITKIQQRINNYHKKGLFT